MRSGLIVTESALRQADSATERPMRKYLVISYSANKMDLLSGRQLGLQLLADPENRHLTSNAIDLYVINPTARTRHDCISYQG